MSKKIIDRIQKLLSLAANNTEPAEIEAAMLMARKLMAEPGLSEGDVEAEGVKQEEIRSARAWAADIGRDYARVEVLNAVATAHRCMVTLSGFGLVGKKESKRDEQIGKKYAEAKVHGRESDVTVVNALFAWAWEKADYLAQIVVKKAMAEDRRKARPGTRLTKTDHDRYNEQRYSFIYGFAHGLRAAYAAQLSANPTWALVLATPIEVKEHVQQLTGGATSKQPSPQDLEALDRGKKAGEQHVAESTHREREALKPSAKRLER